MKYRALILLLTALPAFAHHGDAGRYEENTVVMTGTVVEVQLVDPHSILVPLVGLFQAR